MSTGAEIQTVVPAEPGWKVAVLNDSEDLYRMPVIAWHVAVSRQNGRCNSDLTPICPTAYLPKYEGWIFEDPKGRRFIPDAVEFDTEQDMIDHLRAAKAAHKAGGYPVNEKTRALEAAIENYKTILTTFEGAPDQTSKTVLTAKLAIADALLIQRGISTVTIEPVSTEPEVLQ